LLILREGKEQMTIETLRARRIKLRVPQYVVAKLAGISRNRLSLAECGYIEETPEDLQKIDTALTKIEMELHKVQAGLWASR
jgi:transcriptional regulator with XRE-family HTH domain